MRRRRPPRGARVSSLMPAFSVSRSTRTSGSSISCSRSVEAALARAARAGGAASSCDEHGARGLRVVGRRRPSRAPRRARRAGSRGARGRAGRRRPRCRTRGSAGTSPSALASCAIDRPVAGGGDELGRVGDLAGERVVAAARRRRSASRLRAGAARPRAISGARGGERELVARQLSRASPGAALAHRDRAARSAASGRGIASASARAERLLEPAQRVAQLELAEHLAQLRAVGLARRTRPRGRCRPGRRAPSSRAAWRCARRRRARSGSRLRLAPEISSTLREHRPRASPKRCSSSRGGLVADAGDAGDVVGRVALEPDEVGDQLGRDAVAVDHALAVVDLRVGDAARRSS